MKYLVGAQPTDQKVIREKQLLIQPRQLADQDSPNSSQNNANIGLKKKVKKKPSQERNKAKGSITTRGDDKTIMSSKCPSNFSFVKSSHRFERLKKEVEVRNEAGRCVPITTDYEILRFRGYDRKTNYRFYCFPDELLDIPSDLRQCLRTASVDFDVQSSDGQIEASVAKLTKQLKLSIEEHNARGAGASNNERV